MSGTYTIRTYHGGKVTAELTDLDYHAAKEAFLKTYKLDTLYTEVVKDGVSMKIHRAKKHFRIKGSGDWAVGA